MSIHPMVQEFLNRPSNYTAQNDPPIDLEKMKANSELAVKAVSVMSPEQNERVQKAVNLWLFGKESTR